MNVLGNILYKIVFKYRNLAKVVFILVVAFTTIFFYKIDLFNRLELLSVDYRFKLRPVQKGSPEIVFIDMAEDSIKSIGRWPWPRKWHAVLVASLAQHSPRAIAFDILFSEPENKKEDSLFAQAIKSSDSTYLPLLYNLSTENIEVLNKGDGIVSVLEPIEEFRKYIKDTGHINALPDPDGILRRVPPVIEYKGDHTYQFGFKIGCDILGVEEENIKFYPDKHLIFLEKPNGEKIRVPLDKDNQLMINWLGKWGKVFSHYSYIELMYSFSLMREGKEPIIDPSVFKDKICIIGLTASALIDIKPTPVSKTYPAVSVHAMTISSILKDNFIKETPQSVDIGLIIFVSTIIILLLLNLRPTIGMGLSLLSIIIYFIFSVFLFNVFNILTVTFYPIVSIFLAYFVTTVYSQALQAIERTQLFTQATRDGLTQLYNIRYFNVLLEAEFKNITLYRNRRLSVVIGDIDDFKQINDTYGHQAGDEVIKEVANVVRSKCRQIDIAARYGGEEFIIMLIGAGRGWTTGVGEKIRETIAQKKFNFKGKESSVTISIGVAEYSNERKKEELIEKADKALYRAKRDGKNRVVSYSNIEE